MPKARAAATKDPVVKEVARSAPARGAAPRGSPTPAPTPGPKAAAALSTRVPAGQTPSSGAPTSAQTSGLPDNVKGWGLGGAVVAIAGLLAAWLAAAQGDLTDVQSTPLAAVGAVIAADALWVRLAGTALAAAGVGLGILGVCQTRLGPESAARRIMAWSTGALATTWIIAGMFLALAADLATAWGHGAGAKAAFAAANIITGAPAGVLLATAAGSAACVWARSGRRFATVLGAIVAVVALALTGLAINDALAGTVAIATIAWAALATVPLMQGGRV